MRVDCGLGLYRDSEVAAFMKLDREVNERTLYGGQAVIEGVMMRSPRFFAVACRRTSNGEIVVRQENVESMMAKWQWLNKPFLRGTLALVDSLLMGYKA